MFRASLVYIKFQDCWGCITRPYLKKNKKTKKKWVLEKLSSLHEIKFWLKKRKGNGGKQNTPSGGSGGQ